MSRLEQLEQLRNAAPAILPSLLLCNFANLELEVRRLESAGVQALHLDVMDGNFVPNLTYGMPIVQAVRQLTNMPLDVHLMIRHPASYVRQFCEAGADLITIHVEAVDDPRPVLTLIRELDVASGIALNPDTPVGRIEQCLDLCDLALVMSVNAGFGGQKFNPTALDKLRHLHNQYSGEMLLEVDGGLNASTLPSCAEAGADLFVVGSAIFRQDDYSTVVRQLHDLAKIN